MESYLFLLVVVLMAMTLHVNGSPWLFRDSNNPEDRYPQEPPEYGSNNELSKLRNTVESMIKLLEDREEKEMVNTMQDLERREKQDANTLLQDQLDDLLKEGVMESHEERTQWRAVCSTNPREVVLFRHLHRLYILAACRVHGRICLDPRKNIPPPCSEPRARPGQFWVLQCWSVDWKFNSSSTLQFQVCTEGYNRNHTSCVRNQPFPICESPHEATINQETDNELAPIMCQIRPNGPPDCSGNSTEHQDDDAELQNRNSRNVVSD